jgi:O-antigen/teichoic acid export membrane protein
MLTLVSTAILARLLTPRDFGLVALAVLFITLLDTLSDLGVSQALVIGKHDDELELAETTFVWTVLFGAGLSLATAALSPLAALFFGQPRLALLLSVLGLRFVVRGFGATHYALAQKRIDFRWRTAAELADVGARGFTGIGLALAGFGVWSLVLAYVAGSIAFSVTLWLVVPWRPKLRPKRSHLPHMLRFGGLLTAVDINAAVQNNVDYAFIGRVLGTTDLGLYTLGFRLPELLIATLSVVAGRVLFPAFAAIERSDLSYAFVMSLRYTLMVALPMTAALAVLAHPFVLLAFGDQWGRSVPVMQLLTVFALGAAIGTPAGTAYKATGSAGVLLALGLPRTFLLFASIAIFIHGGIVAVAACVAAVTTVSAAINLGFAMRLLQVGPRRIWSAAWPSLVSAGGMAAVLIPIDRVIASPWQTLVVGAVLGGSTYLTLLWVFARDALIRLRELAFPRPSAPDDVISARETEVIV